MPDFYSVLGLSPRANGEDIKAAYRILAKGSHPDLNRSDREAEQRIQDINRAYETLGDPERRTAYDMELKRVRAAARRSFFSAAAMGAVTFMLMAGSVSLMLMQRQQAGSHHSPVAGSDMIEQLVKPPADDRAEVYPQEPARSDWAEAPAPAMNAPLPQPLGEPARSAIPTSTDSASGNSDPQIEREAAAEASANQEEPAQRDIPSTAAPLASGAIPVVQEPMSPPTPGFRSPHDESAPAPEIEQKPPIPAATVDRPLSLKASRDGRTATINGRIHGQSQKHLNTAEIAKTTMPRKRRNPEREPHLVSSSAMALRFPSADEPHIDMGVRNR